MIEYVTCESCLQTGKKQRQMDLIAKDGPITSLVCPHCYDYKENLEVAKNMSRKGAESK